MKKYLPLVLIIIVACIFRFVYLDKIPNALNGDEIMYAITAKSIWLTGHDSTGTWNPLSAFIFHSPPNELSAELPYFLQLIVSGFPSSLLTAKLPFAVLSVGIVILLYIIAAKLFGQHAAVATGFIAAINPWLIVMGRTGYESTPATFFYLAGFYLLITLRSWNILWSFLPFVLAFYSYIGTKLLFVPFIFLTALLGWYRQKTKFRTPYLVLCAISVLFITIYLVLLKSTPGGTRLSEVLLPNSPFIRSQVDAIRKSSLSSSFAPIISNKYSAYFQILFSKLFEIFSPQYLFVQGDQFFLPISQSFFYYLDSIFMILGFLILFTRKRAYAGFLVLFVLLGSLQHVFHKTMSNYSLHLTLMFPFLILLIGIGLGEGLTMLTKRLRVLAILTVTILYFFNILGFVSNYFYQYPMTGSGDFPMRILSRYIQLAKASNMQITLYSSRKGDFFYKYLFYTNGMNSRSMPNIEKINTLQSFNFSGVQFRDCATNNTQPAAVGNIAIYDATCDIKPGGSTRHISRLTDGGVLYTIVNDPVCTGVALNAYPSGVTLGDMSVEELPLTRFCTIYVSQ